MGLIYTMVLPSRVTNGNGNGLMHGIGILAVSIRLHLQYGVHHVFLLVGFLV